MPDEFDAIVLGAGHNGLIVGAYLARAGLSVLCLERRERPGGGLATIESPTGSGFFHNTHSFFHRGVTQLPWFNDLELARHEVQYVTPHANVALVTSEGRALIWHTEIDKTLASVAQFSERDAETLGLWTGRFRTIVDNVLRPEAESPPWPPDVRRHRWKESSDGRQLLELEALSPWDFVTREFEHPTVQAGLLFFNGLREINLMQPGMAHHIPALFASQRMAQMCIGGSGKLAEGLVTAFESFGGAVITGVELDRLFVHHDRVTGVKTKCGQHFRAKHLVVSSLNPQQTFLELLGNQHVSSRWRSRARNFHYNLIAPLFGLYANLSSPPLYGVGDAAASVDDALMVIVGLDRANQFSDIVQHHQAGTIPSTVMWGSCPSRFDATQAPPHRHTAFMWEKLPYRLNGDPRQWDQQKQQHGEKMISVWQEYSHEIRKHLLDWFVASPLDTERSLPNMRQGDLLVGSFTHGQLGYHRPFPGAGHYRSHLQGLYLCGSCCHPGGNVTGLPAYNSAQVILSDLGLT
ncbi:MAG: NAD(P)/FAD-dependent oxidoreductase [Pirellulaceae bacterium]|nr:NAD(P)/FAD-dependent oxidoreductase [Pirellulaceae bacterium]